MLSKKPVSVLVVLFFTWLNVWFRERISSDQACPNHKPGSLGLPSKTTQVEYEKLHPETFM